MEPLKIASDKALTGLTTHLAIVQTARTAELCDCQTATLQDTKHAVVRRDNFDAPLWLPKSRGDAPQQRCAAAQPQLLTAEPPAAAASPLLTVAAALLPARPKLFNDAL